MNAPAPTPRPDATRALRRRIVRSGTNARDWLRRGDDLVLAERTPYEEIWREDIFSVRHYLPLTEEFIEVQGQRVAVERETHPVPIVLVAPLAVTMRIYDLFPERSFVKYLRARGFDVYLVDWGRPTPRHDNLRFSDYIEDMLPRAIATIRAHSGAQVLSLHGWSLGAMMALSYTALGDAGIRNLVLVGAPCDYHANGAIGKQYQRLSRQLRFMEKITGLSVRHVPPRVLRSPGWANALMFKLSNPAATLQGYAELLRNLHDREFVAAHATNSAFLDDMTDYPGAVVQDMAEFLFRDNCLTEGRPPLRDTGANFRDVTASLLLVEGRDDTLVMPQATRPLMNLVGSPDRTLVSAPGGHMGIVGGSRAPETVWKPMVEWLEARSH